MKRAAIFLLVCLTAAILYAEPVTEKYDTGVVKRKYATNEAGKPHGKWVEFFEDGSRKLVKNYANGVLQGDLVRYDEGGEVLFKIRFGPKNAMALFTDPGQAATRPLYPRGLSAVKKELRRLLAPPTQEFTDRSDRFDNMYALITPTPNLGDLKPAYTNEVLRRLSFWRYLAGVGHRVALDGNWKNQCQHAAVVIAINGVTDWLQPYPRGLNRGIFNKGRNARKQCIVHEGDSDTTAMTIVDEYIEKKSYDDINVIGERGWLLSPVLGRLGLGEAEAYTVFYTRDRSGARNRHPGLIVWPGEGYVPIDELALESPWSVQFQKALYEVPDSPEVRMYVLNDDWDVVEEISVLDVGVDRQEEEFDPENKVIPKTEPGIVFVPDVSDYDALVGKRILVSIDGVKSKRNEGRRVQYLVHFFRYSD
jgi:hypothetical protein